MSNHYSCNLCGSLDGHVRDGRLGRYQITCDECEARKGTHLVKTANGYGSQLVERRETVAA